MAVEQIASRFQEANLLKTYIDLHKYDVQRPHCMSSRADAWLTSYTHFWLWNWVACGSKWWANKISHATHMHACMHRTKLWAMKWLWSLREALPDVRTYMSTYLNKTPWINLGCLLVYASQRWWFISHRSLLPSIKGGNVLKDNFIWELQSNDLAKRQAQISLNTFLKTGICATLTEVLSS